MYPPVPKPTGGVGFTQAMLGIYWRLLSMKRDVAGAHQGFADQLLQLIEMNPAIWRNMVFDVHNWDEFAIS